MPDRKKQARVEQILKAAPVVPVMVIDEVKQAVPLAKALVAGGLPVLEITLRTATAMDSIRAIMAEVKGAIVGAGTVMTPAQLEMVAKAGCAFIAIPAAFTKTTGEAHWHILQRARAIETGAFVISAAQGGRHANGRQTYGHSAVVDCWGRVLAELPAGEGVAVADVDFERQARVRVEFPALEHRVLGRTIS